MKNMAEVVDEALIVIAASMKWYCFNHLAATRKSVGAVSDRCIMRFYEEVASCSILRNS